MKKRLFVDENGYPCAPGNINNELWLYSEPKGLHIITRPGGDKGHIPWATIRRALADHDKANSRRIRK